MSRLDTAGAGGYTSGIRRNTPSAPQALEVNQQVATPGLAIVGPESRGLSLANQLSAALGLAEQTANATVAYTNAERVRSDRADYLAKQQEAGRLRMLEGTAANAFRVDLANIHNDLAADKLFTPDGTTYDQHADQIIAQKTDGMPPEAADYYRKLAKPALIEALGRAGERHKKEAQTQQQALFGDRLAASTSAEDAQAVLQDAAKAFPRLDARQIEAGLVLPAMRALAKRAELDPAAAERFKMLDGLIPEGTLVLERDDARATLQEAQQRARARESGAAMEQIANYRYALERGEGATTFAGLRDLIDQLKPQLGPERATQQLEHINTMHEQMHAARQRQTEAVVLQDALAQHAATVDAMFDSGMAGRITDTQIALPTGKVHDIKEAKDKREGLDRAYGRLLSANGGNREAANAAYVDLQALNGVPDPDIRAVIDSGAAAINPVTAATGATAVPRATLDAYKMYNLYAQRAPGLVPHIASERSATLFDLANRIQQNNVTALGTSEAKPMSAEDALLQAAHQIANPASVPIDADRLQQLKRQLKSAIGGDVKNRDAVEDEAFLIAKDRMQYAGYDINGAVADSVARTVARRITVNGWSVRMPEVLSMSVASEFKATAEAWLDQVAQRTGIPKGNLAAIPNLLSDAAGSSGVWTPMDTATGRIIGNQSVRSSVLVERAQQAWSEKNRKPYSDAAVKALERSGWRGQDGVPLYGNNYRIGPEPKPSYPLGTTP